MGGAEEGEDVVLHAELPNQPPAGEIDQHREARGIEARRLDLPGPRLAPDSVRLEDDAGAEQVEQLLAARPASLLLAAEGFGPLRPKRGGRQGPAGAPRTSP